MFPDMFPAFHRGHLYAIEVSLGKVVAHGATILFRGGHHPFLGSPLAGVPAHGELQELYSLLRLSSTPANHTCHLHYFPPNHFLTWVSQNFIVSQARSRLVAITPRTTGQHASRVYILFSMSHW